MEFFVLLEWGKIEALNVLTQTVFSFYTLKITNWNSSFGIVLASFSFIYSSFYFLIWFLLNYYFSIFSDASAYILIPGILVFY